METKQTTVDWLFEQIFKDIDTDFVDKLKAKAKAMEIDQMKHAFDVASMYDYDGGFEEYHEEFYGK